MKKDNRDADGSDFEIGIDCEDIQRFDKKFLDKQNLNKIFTEQEIRYCRKKRNPSQYFCAKFAAKEAIFKAFSQSGHEVPLQEIEIENDAMGRPRCRLKREEYLEYKVKISITHSKTMAIAVAVVWKPA